MLDFSFTISAWQLGLALGLGVSIVGPGYAWLLNHPTCEWLPEQATELSVVIGVLFTLALLLVFLPWMLVILIFLTFASTGIWQLLRSSYNRHVRRPAAVRFQKNKVAQLAEEARAKANGAARGAS